MGRKLILLLCVWGFGYRLLAQPSGACAEQVRLQTDKPYYVSGEYLWFSAQIFGLEGTRSTLSKVLYLELVNPEGQVISRQKLPVAQGLADGRLFLSPEWSSGTYYLLAYTAWMRNQPADVLSPYPILLINPYLPEGLPASGPLRSEAAVPAGKPTSQGITIRPDARTYASRTPVSLELEIDHAFKGATLSLSVYKVVPSLEPSIRAARQGAAGLKSLTPVDVSRAVYAPEYHGPLIQGRHHGPGRLAANLLFPGKGSEVYGILPNDDGSFLVEVSPDIQASDLIIWADTGDFQAADWALIDPFWENKPPLSPLPFSLTPEGKEILQQLAVNSQIAFAYAAATHIQGLTDTLPDRDVPFYGAADVRYRLDDYTRFPGLEEVIFEYVRYVTQHRRNRQPELRVWDAYANALSLSNSLEFDQAALVMLDGIPLTDLDLLWSLDARKVDILEVVTRKYYTAGSTFHGIVNFLTYEGNFADLALPETMARFEYLPLASDVAFYAPDHQQAPERQELIPDFRNTLFWQPSLRLHASEPARLSFFTGDDPGSYLISVQGYTDEGVFLSGQTLIHIP